MFDGISFLLLLLAMVGNLLWLLISGRLLGPFDEPDPSPAVDQTAAVVDHSPHVPRTWRTNLKDLHSTLTRHRQATLLVVLALAAAGSILLLAPQPPVGTLPGQNGRPLQGLHYLREFELRHARLLANLVVTACALLSLGLLAVARARRVHPDCVRHLPLAGLLVAALGLAGLGQVSLLGFIDHPGVGLYLGAAALFALWASASGSRTRTYLLTSSWSRSREMLMVSLALGLTIIARFFQLRGVPYGIEGDESKWTIEVIGVMVDGRFPISSDLHYATVPASFFMQAPFHLLFGPGILSARIEVATFSVLASLIFYVAARSIANPPVAWLATILLGASMFDVNASRLANVESHVKIWPVLALALLLRAVRTGEVPAYLLSGVAISLGLLTYETTSPLIGVCLLILLVECIRARVTIAEGLRRLSALLGPVFVIAPLNAVYQYGRVDYYLSNARGGELRSDNLAGGLWSNFEGVLSSIFVAARSDFLFNRRGPLFDGLLLPWLVLGLVASLVYWHHGRLVWAPIFMLLFFVPLPIITHAPLGRVFYPGLPGAYLLIAIGLYVGYRELTVVLGPTLRPLVTMLSIVGLIGLLASDLYIAFNEVDDPTDRLDRRAIYDVTRAAAGPDALVLIPFVPNSGDAVEAEQEFMIWLGMRVPDTTTGQRYPYLVTPLDTLLPTIAALGPTPPSEVDVIWHTAASSAKEQRAAVLAQLLQCYPEMEHVQGQRFDRYLIPAAVIQQSSCRQ